MKSPGILEVELRTKIEVQDTVYRLDSPKFSLFYRNRSESAVHSVLLSPGALPMKANTIVLPATMSQT